MQHVLYLRQQDVVLLLSALRNIGLQELIKLQHCSEIKLVDVRTCPSHLWFLCQIVFNMVLVSLACTNTSSLSPWHVPTPLHCHLLCPTDFLQPLPFQILPSVFSMWCIHIMNRHAIAMMSSVWDGHDCDHTVHFSTDLSSSLSNHFAVQKQWELHCEWIRPKLTKVLQV